MPQCTLRVHSDAASVKTRGHQLEDKDLRVVEVVGNQLLLGDVPQCLREDLQHFIEGKTNLPVEDVHFGEEGNNAVVTFGQDIGENKTVDAAPQCSTAGAEIKFKFNFKEFVVHKT